MVAVRYREIHFDEKEGVRTFVFRITQDEDNPIEIKLYDDEAKEIADFINRFRLTSVAADAAISKHGDKKGKSRRAAEHDS